MVNILFDNNFKRSFSKIKDIALKQKILKQLSKIKDNPEIGKPMRFSRKGTRELYIPPYRLSYFYLKEEQKAIILCLYHKDKQ